MPRPKKYRKVCCLPRNNAFFPVREGENDRDIVIITVDEYETVRLIDNEGFSQEECSKYMNIARTTVQQIYDNARKSIAHALVEGVPLKIEGGNYQLCNGEEEYCGCGGCRKHKRHCMQLNQGEENENSNSGR